MKKQELKILYVQTNEITLLDIPRVLDEMGYEVYHANFEMQAQEYEEEACVKIMNAIGAYRINCVISYDFIMTIAQACFEAGVPYIAWVYDSPQKELYTHYALYPSNYVFAFDRMQTGRLKEIGIEHAVHMPLAVHADKVKLVTDVIGKKFQDGYKEEIVFIGQLYQVENEAMLLKYMDDNLEQQLEENIETCFMKWNKDTRLHGLMSKECVAYFGELEGHKVLQRYPYMSEQLFYEAAVLSGMIANRERVHILNKLAEKYNVTFYTHVKDTSQLSDKVIVKPGMAYDVLSHIYRRSKINLNITLRSIETGVPQRVLDVMAAGGFMLSNYQEELEEMFVPGEEIVLYHNEQELEELVEYYLTHEEERERIAQKGREKVLREYNFHENLERVLQYVCDAEADRQESYMERQQRELWEKTDSLLKSKTKEDYQQIYDLYTNKLYDTVISKKYELVEMKEMINFWKYESQFDVISIFNDIDNVEQVGQKYMELKHMLWRVEQGLSDEKCMEIVERLMQGKVSMLFIPWLIRVELRDAEATLIRLSQLIAQVSIAKAVEMLSYGLLYFKGNAGLLVQQADFLMELNLWEQALNTLLKIEEPAEEIKEVIKELSEALEGTNE